MIATLTGTLAAKDPSRIILNVHGVGYEVLIPLSTYFALPEPETPLTLQIFTALKEDAIQLFGFLTLLEKDAFLLLTKISGVGGKLALSILSTLAIPDLTGAIQNNDLEKLASVPGIGKKSAGRIVLELKDKIALLQGGGQEDDTPARPGALRDVQNDAVSALVNLGYRPREVKDAVTHVSRMSPLPTSLNELIREGLKILSSLPSPPGRGPG